MTEAPPYWKWQALNNLSGLRTDILRILLEGPEPCLEGDKPLEEGTRILQNRVRNLMKENL